MCLGQLRSIGLPLYAKVNCANRFLLEILMIVSVSFASHLSAVTDKQCPVSD